MGLKYFEEASKWIGTSEIKGSKHNPAIVKFANYTSLKAADDETPWCSSFVNFVVQSCGDKGTNSAAARSWLSWGKKIVTPTKGSIVVIDRKDKSNPNAAHVGFYVGEGTNPDTIRVLGGNQGDMVKISDYSKLKVLEYREVI